MNSYTMTRWKSRVSNGDCCSISDLAKGAQPGLSSYPWSLLVVVIVVVTAVQALGLHFTRRVSSNFVIYSVHSDSLVAENQRQQLQSSGRGPRLVELNELEQREYVYKYCGAHVRARHDEFHRMAAPHLAVELYKYCALSTSNRYAAAYLDLESPLMQPLEVLLHDHSDRSIAIVGDSYLEHTIHGSLLVLRHEHIPVAKDMLQLLSDTPTQVLTDNPLVVPRALYALIASSVEQQTLQNTPNSKREWHFLFQYCSISAHAPEDEAKGGAKKGNWLESQSYRPVHSCPSISTYCCSVIDTRQNAPGKAVLMNRHPVHPCGTGDDTSMKLPYNWSSRKDDNNAAIHDDLPFISTIDEIVMQHADRLTAHDDKLLFDDLLQNNCLPSTRCNECLRYNSGKCGNCKKICQCHCRTLCRYHTTPPFVSKRLLVTPPLYSRHPDRLIPQLVHQLYPVDQEEMDRLYPGLKRVAQSVRLSGWEYQAHFDSDAMDFLRLHFPIEVQEVYGDVEKGKFQRDLYAFCVLLIHGGAFVDGDFLLDSTLDMVIDPDVGFMAPVAENSPGCLADGFLAVAPGHPFLAKAIEKIVNQARNHQTMPDIDYEFCNAEYKDIGDSKSFHLDQRVNVAGACTLGRAINEELERPLHARFVPGSVLSPQDDKSSRPPIPGRVVFLQDKEHDMGGHRITVKEKNLLVGEAKVEVAKKPPDFRGDPLGEEEKGHFEFTTMYGQVKRTTDVIRILVER